MEVNKGTKKSIFSKKYILFAIFFLFQLTQVSYKLEYDMWFILSTGREIVNHGGPYYQDVLTMHEGLDIVIQQWLYDLAMWKIYDAFGISGIFMVSVLAGFMITVMLYKLYCLISDGQKSNAICLAFFISLVNIQFVCTRPYPFSNLLHLLAIYCLEWYALKGYRRALYFLPFISIALVNIHAPAWPLFVCIAIAYALDIFLPSKGQAISSDKPKKPFVISILASMAVSLCNPYGIKMITYVFNSLGTDKEKLYQFIGEMKPLSTNFIEFYSVAIFAIVLIFFYSRRKFYIRYIVLSIGMTLLAFLAYRGLAQFYYIACVPLAYFCKDYDIWGRLNKVTNMKILVIIAAIAVTVGNVLNEKSFMHPEANVQSIHAPAVNAIIEHSREHNENIVLFNEYNNGPYCEFMGLKPYIDTRYEVFRKPMNHKYEYFAEYMQVRLGTVEYHEFFKKYGFNYFFLEEGNVLYYYLPYDKEFTLIFEDEENSMKVFYRKSEQE